MCVTIFQSTRFHVSEESIVAFRAVYRQRLGKHVSVATDTHATIEVLLEMVFSTRSIQRGYKDDN
jgi:hypothetical protein